MALALLLATLSPFEAMARRRPVRRDGCTSGVVTSRGGIVDFVSDDGSLYFTDFGGTLNLVPASGGEDTTLVALSPPTTWAMFVAVDTENVYFNGRQIPSNHETVYAVSKATGATVALMTGSPPAFELIPKDEWLYLLSPGTPVGNGQWLSDGSIIRIRKDGTGHETIASGLRVPMAMRIDGPTIYFTEMGTSPADTSGGLRHMSTGGGSVAVLAQLPHAMGLAQDTDNLYVFRRVVGTPTGAIDKVSKTTGAVTPLTTNVGFNTLPALEVFRGSLFVLNVLDDRQAQIEQLGLGTGQRRVLKAFEWGFPQIAVDDCAVYFGTSAGIERLEHMQEQSETSITSKP